MLSLLAQSTPRAMRGPAASRTPNRAHHRLLAAVVRNDAAPTASCSSSANPLEDAVVVAPQRRLLLAAVAAAAAAALATTSRGVFGTAAALAAEYASSSSTSLPLPRIDLSLAPDQSTYDAADPALRNAAAMLQDALNAHDVAAEEAAWTAIIDRYGDTEAPWKADVVGRALGNRGNARARQGKLDAALADYSASMALCPWSVDPVINRGATLEALGRFDDAVADYRAVLAVAPDDPSANNNLGNALGPGLGRWDEAVQYFSRAVALAPAFSFAAANLSLATYASGSRDEAMRQMRSLLRRYADFDDVRAALAAALWAAGLEADAEAQWIRVEDGRYKDKEWVRRQRRWPPALADALQALLELRSVAQPV